MLKINLEKAKDVTNLDTFSSVPIHIGGFYKEFLKMKSKRNENILICPTDALLLQENKIDGDKCIECLLCAHICPSKVVEFKEESSSLKQFIDYSNSDKKFVATWLSLVISSTSSRCSVGFELKVIGGRREKRIPLVIIIENEPLICKVIDSYKDVEKGVLLLNDIGDLIARSGLKPPKKIIVPNESSRSYSENRRVRKSINALQSKYDFTLISLEFLWKKAKDSIPEGNIDWKAILFSSNLLI